MEEQTAVRAWKRRKLIVFPEFQYVLLAANLGIAITISAIMWYLMKRTFSDLGAVGGLSGYEVEYYRKYLSYQTKEFQTSLLWAFSICIVASGFLTLIVSFRFAGPMIRLRNFFKRIVESPDPLPKLEFRDGDYLGDFPPLINEALNVVKNHYSGEGNSGPRSKSNTR